MGGSLEIGILSLALVIDGGTELQAPRRCTHTICQNRSPGRQISLGPTQSRANPSMCDHGCRKMSLGYIVIALDV